MKRGLFFDQVKRRRGLGPSSVVRMLVGCGAVAHEEAVGNVLYSVVN